MSKKDRIAVVISILYFLFPLAVLLGGSRDAPVGAVMVISPLIVYWGIGLLRTTSASSKRVRNKNYESRIAHEEG